MAWDGKRHRGDRIAGYWSKVDRRGPDECWPWLASLNHKGYGEFWNGSRVEAAHRFVYRLMVGPIPAGHLVDHTCHNSDLLCPGGDTCPHRACQNWAHLEPVTSAVNTHRSSVAIATINSRKTHCKRGHEFTPENTYLSRVGRGCRQCALDRLARLRGAAT